MRDFNSFCLRFGLSPNTKNAKMKYEIYVAEQRCSDEIEQIKLRYLNDDKLLSLLIIILLSHRKKNFAYY